MNRIRHLLTLSALLLLVACGPAEQTAVPTTDGRVRPTSTATADAVPPDGDAPEPAATLRPTPAPLDAAEATALMATMSGPDGNAIQAGIGRILATGDQRFAAVFIEMIRASQLGLSPAPIDYWVQALERLTGESQGDDWLGWMVWYGATDLTPPAGFTGWKGALLSPIDARFADFLRDEAAANIRPEEIVWGGVRVDGIPALDNPALLSPEEATYLQPDEPVFGLLFNGEARAYPLRIMDWHERANDVIGGVPVSLAYCTLCGAAVAFDGRIGDERFDFGSSGFLFRSNKLMYDRQTNTLWNQLTGEPVLGDLVGRDLTLRRLPVVLTSWADWLATHPQTLVLDINTGFDRTYTPGAAYGGYFAGDDVWFPVWQRSDLLADKAQVFAVLVDGLPQAYPLQTLQAARVVNDTVNGQDLLLVAAPEPVTVSGDSLRGGEVSYAAGSAVRAYATEGEQFAPGGTADTVVDESGRLWQVTEEALLGPEGESYDRYPGHLAYWFGWFAFFPQTGVYGVE